MDSSDIWRLAVDGGLVLSIAYLCTRLFSLTSRPLNLAALKELEATLNALLHQAEQASIGLGEQLGKQKRSLEETLFEIEGVESRIRRLTNEVEHAKSEFYREQRHAHQLQREMYSSVAMGMVAPTADTASYSGANEEREIGPKISRPQPKVSPQPKPERSRSHNFESAQASHQRSRIPATENPPEAQREIALNIFGEPIEVRPQKSSAPRSPSLANSVEKISYSSKVASPAAAPRNEARILTPAQSESEDLEFSSSSETAQTLGAEEIIDHRITQSIEDIYSTAEALLKAGNSLESVRRETNLPEDEVRMLSHIVARENLLNRVEKPVAQPKANLISQKEIVL